MNKNKELAENIPYPALKKYIQNRYRIEKVAEDYPEEIEILVNALKETQEREEQWFQNYIQVEGSFIKIVKNITKICELKKPTLIMK